MNIPKKARLQRRNTPMVGLFSSRRKPNSKDALNIPNKDEELLIIGESEECEDEEESAIIEEEEEEVKEDVEVQMI